MTERVIKYQLLKKHQLDNPDEFPRYTCSECDHDVFVLDIHAELAHQTEDYVVDETPTTRPHKSPFHPCGLFGCVIDGHDENTPHQLENTQGV